MSYNDFWDTIYIDGDMDKDDSFGKWYENPKYVNEPPHVFVRKEVVQPKPSTDFTTPLDNPGEDYLMYEKGIGWVVGWVYEGDMSKYYYHCHIDEEIVEFWPSHWLPMPEAPDT